MWHCPWRDTKFGRVDCPWYSETGGLSYDEPKANTWHLLVWICYERGSRHPLTAAVHKWSYESMRHSLFDNVRRMDQAAFVYQALHLSVTSRQGSGQFDTWKRQPGRPRKCWVEQVTTSTGLSLSDVWSVATDRSACVEGATTRRRSSVERQTERERERERGPKFAYQRVTRSRLHYQC